MNFNSSKLFLACLIGSSVCFLGCESQSSSWGTGEPGFVVVENGKYIDRRDGNTYGVALIGGYYWMTENLRYADSSSMKDLKGESWCYENDKKECEKHGRLYSWKIASRVCPEGWELPTSATWKLLNDAVDMDNGEEGSGTSLKSTDGWKKSEKAASPTNRYGFYATASGRRNNDGENFMSTGENAFFWSSTPKDEGTAYGWNLRYDNDLFQEGYFYKDHGLSVRCVVPQSLVNTYGPLDSSYVDDIPHEYGTLKFAGETYRTTKIGDLEWMADNLNADIKGSHCYNDEESKCEEYGRLYTYEMAKDACPDGWRLPTAVEFTTLAQYSKTSAALRSTEGWSDKASKGLNFWGFDAKPAGGKENSDYFDMKTSAYFWAEASDGKTDAPVFWINYYKSAPSVVDRNVKNEFSIRCVKD